jgi:hypothetical protein
VKPEESEEALKGASTARTIGLAVLVLLTAAAIWLKWGKLNSLLTDDPAWWLNEYARYARGELPYHDYYWPYGPLSADIFAWPMRWLGVRFAVVQTIVDVLSALIVVLVYKIARRLMPPPLPEITGIWLVAVMITVHTYFSLFSMIGYTPSVHVSAIGLLLMMWAVFAYLDDGRPRIAWIALGAWVACLAKHEPALAAVFIYGLLALFDRGLWFEGRARSAWLRRYVALGFLCFLPPLAAYAGWAVTAGWSKFSSCLTGFGLAAGACPWWPTGYGLVGALVALGEAWILLAIASLFLPAWRSRFGDRYWMVWIVAFCAAAGAIAFEWPWYARLLFGPGGLFSRLSVVAENLLSTSAILRPVLWVSYIVAGAIVVSAIQKRLVLDRRQLRDLILVGVPCLMSVRSLFGSTLAPNLEAPAIAYPFLLLVGPYLLYSTLVSRGSKSQQGGSTAMRAIAYCAVLMIGYSIVRLVGGYPTQLSNASFGQIETPAGRLWLQKSEVEKPILDYVLANTAPSDTILDLPVGGGLSFSTGRSELSFTTLMIQLRPPGEIQQEDLRRIQAHPPAVVVAARKSHLGTLYGTEGTFGCVFPRFVWQRNQLSSDPSYIYPVVDFLQRNYRVDRTIGDWVLLKPLDSAVERIGRGARALPRSPAAAQCM